MIKYIIQYYLFEQDKNGKFRGYAVIMAMFELLKFDVKFICSNFKLIFALANGHNSVSYVDLIIKKNNAIIYITITCINRNTNNNNYSYLSSHIMKQKGGIGVKNINIILYIYGEKLLDHIEKIFRLEHPDVPIFYNKIDNLPEPKVTSSNVALLTQSVLGFICSYHHSDYIFNKLIEKFSKYELCIFEDFYKNFDKRMKSSNITTEKYRWDSIKHKLNIIYKKEFSDDKSIFDYILNTPTKKNPGYFKNKYFKYIFDNNFFCFYSGSEIGKNNEFINGKKVMHSNIPIYGAKSDIIFRNFLMRKLYSIYYRMYAYYFIYFVKI